MPKVSASTNAAVYKVAIHKVQQLQDMLLQRGHCKLVDKALLTDVISTIGSKAIRTQD